MVTNLADIHEQAHLKVMAHQLGTMATVCVNRGSNVFLGGWGRGVEFSKSSVGDTVNSNLMTGF